MLRKELFDELDTNGSGYIEIVELKAALEDYSHSPSVLATIFNQIEAVEKASDATDKDLKLNREGNHYKL